MLRLTAHSTISRHMKYLLALVITAGILIGGFFALNAYIYDEKQGEEERMTSFRIPGTALTLMYREDPYGYRADVFEPRAEDDPAFEKAVVFMLKEDFAQLQSDVPREGPPTISISVYKNEAGSAAREWAESHPQFSNVPLMIGESRDVRFGGAQGIRYMVDGLYPMDTVILAHDARIYIVSGAYLDENSLQRQDFGPLLDSMMFSR